MSRNNGQMTEEQRRRALALLNMLDAVKTMVEQLGRECDPGDNGELMSALSDAEMSVDSAECHLKRATEVFDPY